MKYKVCEDAREVIQKKIKDIKFNDVPVIETGEEHRKRGQIKVLEEVLEEVDE